MRFSLAHISWPWCDELIAAYGKILNASASRADYRGEMFVDITPGTPTIYRREALTKLFTVGYDIQDNVIFGRKQRSSDTCRCRASKHLRLQIISPAGARGIPAGEKRFAACAKRIVKADQAIISSQDSAHFSQTSTHFSMPDIPSHSSAH